MRIFNAMSRFAVMALFVLGPCISHAQWLRHDWLPIEARTQALSRNPIGWTDGSTARLQAGFHTRLGPLSVRLAPEVVRYRDVRRADILPNLDTEARIRSYIRNELNRIDAPTVDTVMSRTRWIPGESHIGVSAFGVGLKASTESVRWGPGVRHGLILSGTSEGFEHVSLHTTKPLDLWVAKIRGEYLSGRLLNSGVRPELPSISPNPYRKKVDEWRYITGINGSVELRFLPGLQLGATRSFIGYNTILQSTSDYFPLFQPFTKDNFQDDDNPTGNDAWDQQFSVWFSWMFPRNGFRLYAEWGRNDHAADLRDVLLHADHSRADVVGGEKRTEAWHVVAEVTQLAMTKTQKLRASPIWYTHHIVRHGVTHRGQLLGPDIGPGSNSWWLMAERSLPAGHRIGLELEQVHRSEDLFALLFPQQPSRRWSDRSLTARYMQPFGKAEVTVAARLTGSRNYAFRNGYDPLDGSLSLGVRYELD